MVVVDFRTTREHRSDTHWTPERIIEAFQEFAVTMGRAPSTTDVNFNLPSRRAKFSAARIRDAERAHDLGLRLPCATIVRREFGDWPSGVRAAGLTPNTNARWTTPPSREGLRSMSSLTVCPSCGDARWRMDEHTGWCWDCTVEYESAKERAA